MFYAGGVEKIKYALAFMVICTKKVKSSSRGLQICMFVCIAHCYREI